MRKIIYVLLFVFINSCGEKLMQKPENLIPKEEMINILKDFSILNSAKNTDPKILQDYKIEPTTFILTRYGVDSLQFVQSDKYYASLPNEYEAMYIKIEKQLSEEKDQMTKVKMLKDSLRFKEGLKGDPIEKDKFKKPTKTLP